MNNSYASKLKAFRKAKSTQAAMAEKIDISQIHYTKIENGYVSPSLEVHIKICLSLNKPSDCFFRENRPDILLSGKQIERLRALDSNKLKTILEILQVIYEKISCDLFSKDRLQLILNYSRNKKFCNRCILNYSEG